MWHYEKASLVRKECLFVLVASLQARLQNMHKKRGYIYFGDYEWVHVFWKQFFRNEKCFETKARRKKKRRVMAGSVLLFNVLPVSSSSWLKLKIEVAM